MVPVPASVAIERDQEGVGRLQRAEHLSDPSSPSTASHSAGVSCSSTDVRRRNRWTASGGGGQGLAVEVLGDVPIVSCDARRFLAALSGDDRREADPHRPALGPCRHLVRTIEAQLDVGAGEDLARPSASSARCAAPYSTTSSSTRSRARSGWAARLAITICEPAGSPAATTPRTSWQSGDPISWRSSSISTNGFGAAANADARRGAARPERAGAEARHVGGEVCVRRRRPLVGAGQQVQERRRVVIEAVERHPAHRPDLGPGPLRQHGRLPVPGRRGHAHHPGAPARAGVDERGTAHRVVRDARDGQLGIEQGACQADHFLLAPAGKIVTGRDFTPERSPVRVETARAPGGPRSHDVDDGAGSGCWSGSC